MKVPTAAIDSDNGLLGRFNWDYQGKLLIALDENGEFVHNKKGQGHLRSWLCAKQQDYKKECCSPITMGDYANLCALTNELLSMRVEKNGDARSAIFSVDERYSKNRAEKELEVDGEPMAVERREVYFRELYEAINDPTAVAVFAHELVTEDCAEYNFQANIPKNELREDLKEVADERGWVGEFLEAWEARDVRWTGEKTTTEADLPDRSPPQFSTTPTRFFLEPNIEYDTATVYIGLSEWAKAKRDELPTRHCRNHRQLGIYLRQAIKKRKLEKRASNGKDAVSASHTYKKKMLRLRRMWV